MKHYPMYSYNNGDKKNIFDGIKSYLYRIKSEIDNDKKKYDKLTLEQTNLREEINNTFKNNIDTIIALTKKYDKNQDMLNDLSYKMRDNETKFLADLIYLFCD